MLSTAPIPPVIRLTQRVLRSSEGIADCFKCSASQTFTIASVYRQTGKAVRRWLGTQMMVAARALQVVKRHWKAGQCLQGSD